MILKSSENCKISRLFSSSLNVMLACEHSELPRASRNIMAILSKETNSIVFRFLNVITGFIPVILVQRVTNLVNKFAVLLHKYRFRQDCRNGLCVMSGNDRCWGRWLSVYCYPSPNAKALPSPSGSEGLGRSMIEMLGVLAIIAVLSVGGIAGYSKAMEQYKLNKMANEYSFLIQGLMEHVEQLTKTSVRNPENMIGLANFAEAAEMVPATWKRRGSNQFIDSIGNQVALFLRNGQFVIEASMGGSAAMNDEHKYMNESFSLRMCETYLRNVVQPLHAVVHHAFFIRWQQGWTTLFGDRNCSAEGKCLRDLTPADINTICSSCNKNIGSCSVGMQFD